MANLPLIIYVHGFNSSPASWKAQRLVAYMQAIGREQDVLVPPLSASPAEAMEQLQEIVQAHRERFITLVGSSLGGYYSTWLTEHYLNVRSVLVNPAVYPYRLLENWLGENENIYTHERYQLTHEHLAQLHALDVPEIFDPSRYVLLTQTGDETLDYREAVEKFAGSTQYIQEGGSHGFDAFDEWIPMILAFSEGKAIEPPATTLTVLAQQEA
ncbi:MULTISPECIES: YqiA/YcfP family alpha/beta fold hydrolase [Nitrincola]|uniref:Esterase YqiA n=1 Tax=Nitrincola nitratireducens TaxID=1229521 RepID=W9UQT6_9GAMM|nr:MULTISPECIES: YqiA/YcfP family alpha/beta fold hydrolase [Nitrincola]EXJ09439.1 esterase YqiA [Nitrincola nitratireducens]